MPLGCVSCRVQQLSKLLELRWQELELLRTVFEEADVDGDLFAICKLIACNQHAQPTQLT